MKHNKVLQGALLAVVLGVLGYTIGSQFAAYQTRETVLPPENHSGDEHATHTAVEDHTQHASITDERSFIEAMVPHHDEAVRSGLVVLQRGATTEEIRALVTGMVTTQESEITDMQRRYEEWYGEPLPVSSYEPMMRDLSNLSGEALDRAFLEDMIHHHQGAIMMAESVKPFVEQPAISILVDNIIATQTVEIETINAILKTLE